MSMIRKNALLQVEQITDNRTRVIAATNALARDGHVVEPAGLQIANFLRTAAILFDHDPKIPVATPVAAQTSPDGTALWVDVEWPPAGISAKADEVRGLVKAGVIRSVSIGFEPLDAEPLDPRKPRGGLHITRSELLEMSFVSVPADTGAIVTQRSSEESPIDPSKEKAGMSGKAKTEEGRALQVKHQRALQSAPEVLVIQRGLCHVAELAWLLHQLGYAHESAEYEAALEEDESEVPAMIGEGLKQLGEALIAMTKEEVQELLAAATGQDDDDLDDAGVPDIEHSYVIAGKTPLARAWRRGIAWIRAGRTLSAANGKHLERALKHHERAMKQHKAIGAHHEEIGKAVEQSQSAHEKATAAHGELGESLQAIKNEPEKATEHVARALKQHAAVGKQHEQIADAQGDIDEAQQNAVDAHQAQERCMGGIKRCVRAVTEGSQAGEDDDGDSKLVQTSNSIKESSGSLEGRSALTRSQEIEALEKSFH